MKSAGIPNPMILSVGSWAFRAAHGESVRILDVETVWSHTRAWNRCPRPQAQARRRQRLGLARLSQGGKSQGQDLDVGRL